MNTSGDHTEDDTFRILARKPLAEAHDYIFKQIVLGLVVTEEQFEKACKEQGYDMAEIRKYANSII